MSQQLYQLFCEGLNDRSDVLSSTFLVSSTPLEDVGAGPADPDPTAAARSPPAKASPSHHHTHEQVELEKAKAKESPDFSVQGQVGSATESPPVDEEEGGVKSPVAAALSQGLHVQSECGQQRDKNNESLAKGHNASEHSRYFREHNPNVSSVDFVDRVIAVKRRDDAFAKKPKRTVTSSDESQPQLYEPVTKTRKTNEASDSSETDFEGASEYYRSHQTQNSTTQPEKNKTLPKKLSLSSGKSNEESNLNLVMECITSDDSLHEGSIHQSQNLTEEGVEPPSAARCRVFLTTKDRKSKKADCQMNPMQENNTNGTQLITAKVVSSDIQTTKRADIASMKPTAILNGVTAYVEVRSGHDNRSMGVRTQLRNLGAKVLEKLSSEVTHVVFNEGAPSTLRKAQKQGCHLVSVLWIDECKKLGKIVSEADHPPIDLHLYDKPGTYRKLKSFQPDFEEGKAEEKQKKKLKRLQARSQKAILSQPTSQDLDQSSLDEGSSDDNAEETQPSQRQMVPDGVTLKTLSIVLQKIDTVGSSGVSISTAKKNKRKLLPLEQRPPSSLSLENFNLAERVSPQFPYSQSSQKKKAVAPRRIVRHQSSQNPRRRSSCFVRSTQGFSGSKPKKVKSQMPTMVCTFMHRREIDVVAAVLKQLGGWILEPTVSPRTTHVVCGESKRTINLLRGIAHGCWIIRQEWVLRSVEAGHWLDEEPFELTEFPAIQQSRVARETLGASPDIFSSAGAIYVSKDSTPPHAEITDLLQLCGANLVKSARQARVIIGPYQRRASHTDVVHINEQWVLDSIQENMLQPVRRYRL